jgi:hypothetical protein
MLILFLFIIRGFSASERCSLHGGQVVWNYDRGRFHEGSSADGKCLSLASARNLALYASRQPPTAISDFSLPDETPTNTAFASLVVPIQESSIESTFTQSVTESKADSQHTGSNEAVRTKTTTTAITTPATAVTDANTSSAITTTDASAITTTNASAFTTTDASAIATTDASITTTTTTTVESTTNQVSRESNLFNVPNGISELPNEASVGTSAKSLRMAL